MPIQKITPFPWFDHQAEEAAKFYASIFPNSRIVKVVRYGAAGPGPGRLGDDGVISARGPEARDEG